MRAPTALTIAGSDSGGGAGIQADLKAMAAVGVHGASAITCVTSQNTEGVTRVDPLPIEGLLEQIDAVLDDLSVGCVKTGMLHTPEVVEAVADRLAGTDLPLIVDPVMVATSGDALSEGDLPAALAKLAEVTTLITPNVDELERLTGYDVNSLADARKAGKALRDDGWGAVLAKGGHLDGDLATDLLITGGSIHELSYPRAEGRFHGAGCTYASLIAGLVARGHGTTEAVVEARARMHRAIQRGYVVGRGPKVLDALETVDPGAAEGARLSAAAWRIAATLPLELVPEVGINMAYATEGVTQPEDVMGLARRITRTPEGPSAPGPVTYGASGHVARVLLAARDLQPGTTTAMNLAYHPDHVEAARAAGLRVASFDRDDEPPQAASSMSWGTSEAIKGADGPIDLVVDQGGKGKEAMMRLLAGSPASLKTRVDAIAQQL